MHSADVLIVGAGPAGTSAAIALAELGYRVVLAEKTKFPRPHVGESLPPKISRLFQILGVEQAIDTAGFLRMRGTTVHQGDHALTHDFDPDPRVFGYQVDRGKFDEILLERARSSGATILEETSVSDPRALSDARFVIDAGGQKSHLAKLFGARRREAIRTVAVTGYYRGAKTPASFAAENTLFEMRPDGWLWSVLLAEGRRNVTIGVDPERLKGTRPEELYSLTVRSSPLVATLVETAALEGPLVTNDATWHVSDKFALEAENGLVYLLAGDAASFIDPLTSHGVYKAMHSGITAAAVINTLVKRAENHRLALDYYDNHQLRTYEKYADIALTFYRGSPFAESVFWAERTRPERPISAATIDKLSDFRTMLKQPNAAQLKITAQKNVRLERRAIAEGYFILEKPMITVDEEEIAIPDATFDPEAIHPLLDGRNLEQIFEGYIQKTGRPRSKDLAQAIITMLSKLSEKGALDLRW